MPPPLRRAIELLVAHWYENRGLIAAGQSVAVLPATRGGDDRALPGAVAMIDPGELNRRLVLEAPVETPDGAGGVTRSYAEVTTLWAVAGRGAAVRPSGAAATIVAAATGATVTHRIPIARVDSPRLRDGTRIFRIVALRDQDGTGRFTEIAAEERVD